MEHITVKDIVEATGGTLLAGDGTTPLQHISIDSRTMQGNDLFVPLVGEKNDAHRFIHQAMANGAKASLTSQHTECPEEMNGALIRVADTKKALQDIGYFLRSRLTLPLIGITGSVGKTTTREMVAAALSAGYKVFKTPANHNSQIGVPITISEIGSADEIGVLELGMSEPGEMTVISHIAGVDMALITNVGVTHIENLGSRENILHEKLNIQDGLKEGGILFLNGDNDLLKEVKARDGYETVYYGIGENNDYRAVDIDIQEGKPSFVMKHGEQRIPVRLNIMGEHNILNALAALAVADRCHVSLEAAAEKLAEFEGFKNRQQIYENKGITIIDDTYNASPDSMKAGIRVLAALHPKGRRIAVLADMKELGEDSPHFHYEIGEFLQKQPIDEVVTYGELAKEIAGGLEASIHAVCFLEDEKSDMTEYLKKSLKPGDAVLFKGSNSMNLGETAAYFIKTEQVKL
ncbi:MAG: UDP-N-acetylmuramoyl-tripeptide--D-alanyl-D-alanine ligase [Clostridium sp.]